MKQKMRIKISVYNEKCRQKAMRVAVVAKGVISVAMEGESKNELVVVGDGVDAASLVIALRRKVCYATLETLEEVKPPPPPPPPKKPAQVDVKPVTPPNPPCGIAAQCPLISYQQPQTERYVIVHDSYGPNPGCTIM